MKNHYLYIITRDDGEQYIGVTVNPTKRLWQHENGYGSNNLKGKDITMEILLIGLESFIYNKEAEYIEKLKPTLNIAPGGNHVAPCPGERNGRAVLTEKDVLEIRNLYDTKKYYQRELADKFQVSRGQISSIVTGRSWKDASGITSTNRHIVVDSERVEIVNFYNKGMSNSEISKLLGIKYHTVYSYTKNLTPVNRTTHKIPEDILKKILPLRESGLSWDKISKQLGIGSTTVRKHYKRLTS